MALNGTAERHADRPTKFCNADIIPYGFSILWCQFQEPFFYGLSACLGFEESCGQYFHGCYHGDMMYQKRYIVKRVGILDSCRSSSRLRGTPLYIHVTGPITRFIPAFAGNAQCIRGDVYNSTVHPRVCGEHLHPQARRDGEPFLPVVPLRAPGGNRPATACTGARIATAPNASGAVALLRRLCL